jgi:hypothetical protein
MVSGRWCRACLNPNRRGERGQRTAVVIAAVAVRQDDVGRDGGDSLDRIGRGRRVAVMMMVMIRGARGWRDGPFGDRGPCLMMSLVAHARPAQHRAGGSHRGAAGQRDDRDETDDQPLKGAHAGSIPVPHSATFLSRSALPMTDTELNVIAALAIIGLSRRPNTG